MHSLKYTNFILTVIAFCLIYQCIKFGAVPSTAASAKITTKPAVTAPAKVEIVGTPTVKVDGVVETNATVKGVADVNIAAVGSTQPAKGTIPVTVANTVATSSNAPQQSGVMKVEVTNSQVPVKIEDIGFSIMNQLPVEIEGVGFGITGELPVKVKN